jgi:hypothetical protein
MNLVRMILYLYLYIHKKMIKTREVWIRTKLRRFKNWSGVSMYLIFMLPFLYSRIPRDRRRRTTTTAFESGHQQAWPQETTKLSSIYICSEIRFFISFFNDPLSHLYSSKVYSQYMYSVCMCTVNYLHDSM